MANLKKLVFTEKQKEAVQYTLAEHVDPTPVKRPTKAQPGTPEKVKVLASRVARGVALWHPNDPVFEHATHEPAEWMQGYQGNARDPRMLDRHDAKVR